MKFLTSVLCVVVLGVLATLDGTAAVPTEVEAVCTEGSRWYDQCNECWCLEGQAACTKKGCSPNYARPAGSECDHGSRWLKDGCNWCNCHEGYAVCTLRLCLDDSASHRENTPEEEPEQEEEEQAIDWPECEPTDPSLDRWREGCNWCRCSSAGRSMCTRRGCTPAILQRLDGTASCQGKPRWKNDCNWCGCSDNGHAMCTLIACPPSTSQHEPATVAGASPAYTFNNAQQGRP